MTITITKKVTDDELKLDESGGIQFQNPADDDPDPQAAGTPDDDDDDDVALAWVDPDDTNNADGSFDLATSALDDTFLGYLNTLVDGTFLSDDQLAYAASVGGTSDADYLSITTSAGENISSVFFSAPDGGALAGAQVFHDYGAEFPEDPLQTIDGQDVFLWTVGDGSIVLATTSGASVSAGSLVAAFYLESDLSDSEATQFDVKVESVVFVPFDHPDGTDPDDAIDFSEILNVSASGTLGFEFDTLESGNFLWVAVGDTDAALLVTGQDLDVNTDEGSSKYGDIIKGGSDPSDTVNTSQGGINATIGILSQHFTDAKEKGVEKDGPVGVFTLVKGFEPLDGATDGQATGINILDIDYDDVDPYVDAPSASVFISQTEGGGEASLRIELFSVDEGPAPEEGFGYIGDTDSDQETTDDDPVAVVRIEVTRGDTTYVWFDGDDSDASTGEGGDTLGGITVDFLDSDHPTDINDFVVSGVMTGDVIRFFSTEGETFNRFTIQAKAGSSAFDIGRIEIDEGVIKTTAVGQDFLVDDDGPTATASGTPEELVLDETVADPDPDGANDAPAGTTTVTSTGIAALFGGDFGSDGEGSTAFSLDLSNQDIGSGLFVIDDTVANGKGEQILLYQTADDTVIGYVGTDGPGADTPDYETIFTITIDTNSASGTFGEVTFAFGTDYANIWHPDYADGDADDAETLTVGAGEYLRVVQELTDADGDKDSSYRDLGTGVFGVEDDGPLADAAGAPPALTVDETDAAPDPDGPNDAAAGTTSDSASFTSLFGGSVFGSDGAGSTSYGLELSADGIGSGVYALDATQSDGKGDEILLYRQDATTIIGYLDPVGNDEAGDYVTYFTITVDNDASDDADVGATTAFGDVTFTQVLNVWHPLTADGKADDAVHIDVGDGNELNLVQTVTDADLDNDSASFDLGHEILGDGQEAGQGYYVFSIEDDGPKAGTPSAPSPIYLDETTTVTDPGGTNQADAGISSAKSNFGTLFSAAAYGSDGAGSTVLSLEISANGIGSGLFSLDADETDGKGDEILLYRQDATTIVGYVDPVGDDDVADYVTYFTITVDTDASDDADVGATTAFGDVTFTQVSDVWHGNTGDDDDLVSLYVDGAEESFSLRQTVTDADGDSDTSDMDLSANIFFIEDDGPQIDETTIADNLFVGNMIGDSVSDDFTFSNVADAPWAWVITDAPGDFDDTSPYPADVFTWRYADVDEDGEVGQHEIIGTYDGDDLYSLIITDDGSGTATYELEMIGALDGGSRELDSANIKAGGPDTNFIDVGIIGAEASDFVRISGYFDDDGIDTGDDPVPAAVNESNLNVGVKNGNLDSGEILGFSLFENGESEPPTDISGIIIGTKTAQGFNYAWKAYGVDEEGDPVTYDGSGSVGKNEPIIIDVGALVHTIELYNLDGDAVKIGLDDIEILTDPPDFLLNFEGVLHDADGDAYGFDFTVGIDGNDSGALVDPIMVDPLPETTAFELMHVDPIA
ncbi:DUF5801 repeats-in-toxin domain-containing protein [Croceicoccus gelatinilyticus]|uniref:DUF5801 repeats-in-toxin domain-containing protein n=1 Tax=Croceicoccus gelatinilyticus TaxID=2835536 RepID=UPI001BCC794C|nr:DUF5801 repeats-in-toxin domain-containing protein [Croceicoccus gelatinilyticus]MBS7670810.1 hypothetical protein [Croceicoccus gelatinilyticus]